MKKTAFLLVLLLCFSLLTACGQTEKIYTAEDVAGKAYTYEKDGFGGSFTISLFEDGTFHYYEGMLSSYIGLGTWTVEDGVLTLKDESFHFRNRFRIGAEELIFLAEDSSNFMYLTVKDGERFLAGAPKANLYSSWYGGKNKALVSLDQVRDLVLKQNCTEERLKELLEGFTCAEMEELWGFPDGMCSGLWCNIWALDEDTDLIVHYAGDKGEVFEVRIRTKE